MGLDRSELAKGWDQTRQYLLSHHESDEWDRCYTPRIFGRRVRLCARCLGIYPGILLGLLVTTLLQLPVSHYYLVVLLPLPALVDWTVTSFSAWDGYNAVRTVTGLLLGVGYAVGLVHVVGDADFGVIAVGGIYAIAAAALLARANSRGSPSKHL